MTMAKDHSSASPAPPTHSSFPSNPEDFDADPRISFDKLNQKFILETEDDRGNPLEFEFDGVLKRWIPVVRPSTTTLIAPDVHLEDVGPLFASSHPR